MQNPFKHRPSDDFARRDRDDTRWEARNQGFDEGRSWSEGDGGRTAEAWRGQGREDRDDRGISSAYGYGQQSRSEYGRGMSTPYAGDRSRAGSASDPYGHGSQADYGQGSGSGQSNANWSRDYSHADRGRAQDYGRAGDYGGSASWSGGDQSHGYAPGSDIWRGQSALDDRGRSSQSHHDFEPDYLHWRNQQMSSFDRDYADWRDEKRQRFSADFDTWRRDRPQVKAENPIVGDVSDGGTGNAAEAKKT